MTGEKLGMNPITINPKTASSHGRAVLPGSLTLLLPTRAPLPDKVCCLVSTHVSSDNSLLSVRQEPTFEPWKGCSLLKHRKRDSALQSEAKQIEMRASGAEKVFRRMRGSCSKKEPNPPKV